MKKLGGKIKRRILCFLLSLVMVIGMFLPSLAMAKPLEVDKLSTNGVQVKDDNQKGTYIVEIYDGENRTREAGSKTADEVYNQQVVSTFKSAQSRGAELNVIENRINDQNNVLAEIFGQRQISRNFDSMSYSQMADKSQLNTSFFKSFTQRPIIEDISQLEKMPRYKAIMNGFALEMTYGQAKEVAKLDSVRAVTLAREYEKPSMESSREMVNAQIANQRHFDGRGRVVAILDTGADVSHPDLRLSEVGLKAAKYTKESMNKMIAANQLWGTYRTEKIPYAYNYADRVQEIKDSANHGQHIAGTIAGNAKDPSKGTVGIVPEAQLLVMRVFALGQPTTNTSIYAEALDDAVILGADSINMSLGSFAGSQEDSDKMMDHVVENANNAGAIVAIAAGNDGYQFGNQGSQPGDLQDYGTVGAPSTMLDSFAVASYNNDKLSYYELVHDGIGYYTMATVDEYKPDFSKGFTYGKEYELVNCGLGNTDADFEGKDLTGKVALLQRGGESFTTKIKNAQAKGAVAVVMGNNAADPDATFGMVVDPGLIPGFAVSRAAHETLANSDNKTVIINDKKLNTSPNAGEMSNSSSWGPTPNLGIKPEITAPGNNIYSTDNDGGYTLMSGTSMATPHVTAGVSAVRGAIEKAGLNLKGKDLAAFVKNVLMTTARPLNIKNTTDLYYPVRSQGAGLMDLDGATNTNFVTVTDPTSMEAKIEYRQIDKTELTFNLDLKNYSDKAVDYDVYYVLFTDLADENGNLNLNTNLYKPRNIQGKTKIGSISLGAGETNKFTKTVTWDDADFVNDYTNGYFVDGFVFFEAKENAEGAKDFANLSVPFLAYKGEWDKIDVIEPYIHELLADEKTPFWYTGKTEEDIQKEKELDLKATTLISRLGDDISQVDLPYTIGRTRAGEFTDNFAFSPGNPDGNLDYVQFKGVFLRNWADFYIDIFNEDGDLVRKISNVYRSSGRKSGDTVNQTQVFFETNDVWAWDGRDDQGNLVPEGTYKYTTSVRIADKVDAAPQKKVIDLIVDNTAPVINSVSYKDLVVTVDASDDLAGVRAVYYEDALGYATMKEVDGKYTCKLVSDEDLENGKIIAIDWAGNRTEQLVSEESGQGSLTIKWEALDESPQPANKVNVYRVEKDDKGNEKLILVSDINRLQKGTYVVGFDTEPANYEVTFVPERFEITDETSEVTVTAKYKAIDTREFGELRIDLIWSADYNGRVSLFAVDKDGKEYPISNRVATFGSYYMAKLPAGDYTVIARDQDGNPIQLMGPRLVTVEKQQITRQGFQVFFRNKSYNLRTYVVTDNQDLVKKIQDSIWTIPGKDKDGNPITIELINAEDWFNIINTNTNTSVYDEDLEFNSGYDWRESEVVWQGVTKDGLYEFDILIGLPAGNFQVEFKDENREYTVLPPSFQANSFSEDWFGFEVYKKSSATGSLTVREALLEGVKDQPIDSVYTLYNSYGEEVLETSTMYWNKLPVGSYTLEVESKIPELTPERTSYNVVISEKDPDVDVLVRYKNIAEDPNKTRKSGINIGAYGQYPEDLKSLDFVFTNKQTGEKIEKSVLLTTNEAIGKTTSFLVDQGSYTVEITNLNGAIIDSLFLSTFDWNDRSDLLYNNGTTFDIVAGPSGVSIEVSLAQLEKDSGEISIEEVGLSTNQRPTYELYKDGEKLGETQGRLIKNLEPGDYTLKALAPTGYEVSPAQRDLTVVAKEVTKAEFVYTRLDSALFEGKIETVLYDKLNNPVRLIDGMKYKAIGLDGEEYDKIPFGIKVNLKTTTPELVEGFTLVYPTNPVELKQDQVFTVRYMTDEALANLYGDKITSSEIKLAYGKNLTADMVIDALNLEAIPANAIADILVNDGDLGVVKSSKSISVKVVFADDSEKLINVNLVVVPVDKTILENAISKASKLDQSKYTKESWMDFEKVLFEAINMVDKFDVTEEEVQAMVAKLEAAIKALVMITKPQPEPEPPIREEDIFWIWGPSSEDNKKPPIKVEDKKDTNKDLRPIYPVEFIDISNHWAREAIEYVASRGIFRGIDENHFGPDMKINRSMFVTALFRMSQDNAVAGKLNFNDIDENAYYAEALKWAVANNIVNGYEDGSFKPDQEITRYEIAKILAKYLEYKGQGNIVKTNLTIADKDQVPAWAEESVKTIISAGLMQGRDNGAFDGMADTTRAEVAQVFYNYLTK